MLVGDDAGDDDCFVGEDEVLEEGREVAADAIKDRADVSPTLSGNGDHFFSGFQLFQRERVDLKTEKKWSGKRKGRNS